MTIHITIHSPQGGSGKTMLATAIAVRGFGYRSYDPLNLVEGQEKSGVLVIDTPPHWEAFSEAAVTTADLLILPVSSIADYLEKDMGVRITQIMKARAGRKTLVVQTHACPSVVKLVEELSSLPGVTVFPDVITYEEVEAGSPVIQKLLLAVLAQIQPVPEITSKAIGNASSGVEI